MCVLYIDPGPCTMLVRSYEDVTLKWQPPIVIGDFNAKVGRENIFKPTIGTQIKHDISNDNGLRLISFASSKTLVIKSTMFPHKDIYKGTWKSPDGKTVNKSTMLLSTIDTKALYRT